MVVEISPETTTRPVFTSVSQATRPFGSSRMTASRTPSEIWSAILSGWPSVTDSEVNRYSLSFISLMGFEEQLRGRIGLLAPDDGTGSAHLPEVVAHGWEARAEVQPRPLAQRKKLA